MEAKPVDITVAQNVDDWYGFIVYRIEPHDVVTIVNGVPTTTRNPGEQFNYAGWTFRATFRVKDTAGAVAMTLNNSHFSIRTDVPDFVGVKVIVMYIPRSLSAAVTAAGVYDVRARDPNNYEHRLAYGKYGLEAASTRD